MSASTEQATNPPREQFTGQTGFILSAIGSAVGLGNIWRFPGVAYENGGGAFLIPYLVALITAGIPILFLDYAIGHRFRGSAPLALRRLGGRWGRWTESLGWFQVAMSFVIGLYYTAIIGWALSYFVFSFDLKWGDDPEGFLFGDYLEASSEVSITGDIVASVAIPLAIVWIAAIVVLALGVSRGLERANVVIMPLLALTFGAVVVRALFLDGAVDGLNAFFTPDWGALSDPNVWIAAYGQIFFSLSIAFGIMITYASYRRRKANLTGPGLVVAFANSSFELLAGIGVFATLGFFAFQQGIPVAELETISGIGLSFVTFPAILSQMPGGAVVGALFFGTLALAGFTSLLSILQVTSAAVQEKFGLTPRSGALALGTVSAALSFALFSTTSGLWALDTADHWTNNIGVVGSAVIMSVLTVWVLRRGPELLAHLNAVSTVRLGRIWLGLVGVVVPAVLGFMLVRAIVEVATEGYEGYPAGFLLVMGWGVLIALGVITVVATALPWHRNKDEIEPWPPYPAVAAKEEN
ncbi:sodium-dependent transporter [Demequina sp. TTPB684]|uniref:sodium-dependent transporter n=1 Tax=unclassified Demequina TaxID=2620311 RepID=UPI001CF2488B|nr:MULTISPECIES: sodium-dependent transporter [unclassified Demequina]MCB2411953.1 sodium-dependent transporter [Demequina sp. TTPB684]UPU87153.1 sodium-dependent transporter [Demequina sp. TMPB413]